MASDAEIEVSPQGSGFRVVVRESSSSTEHVVNVPDDYVSQLELGDCEIEKVVGESFRFLLERESKESIMGQFELPVIERYFPEYPKEIRKRLGR